MWEAIAKQWGYRKRSRRGSSAPCLGLFSAFGTHDMRSLWVPVFSVPPSLFHRKDIRNVERRPLRNPRVLLLMSSHNSAYSFPFPRRLQSDNSLPHWADSSLHRPLGALPSAPSIQHSALCIRIEHMFSSIPTIPHSPGDIH